MNTQVNKIVWAYLAAWVLAKEVRRLHAAVEAVKALPRSDTDVDGWVTHEPDGEWFVARDVLAAPEGE